MVFSYKKGNYLGLCNYLNDINWKELFDSSDIGRATKLFYDKLENGMNLYIPKIKMFVPKFPRWMSPQLKNLIINKKIAHKIYKETNNIHTYQSFKEIRKLCKLTAERDYTEYNRKLEKNFKLNPRDFYKHINSRRIDTSLPSQFSLNGENASEGDDIANLFAKHFASVYSNELLASPQFKFNTCLTSTLSHVHVQEDQVQRKLKTLKPVTTSGPDNVPAVVLKNCAKTLAKPLTILFNRFNRIENMDSFKRDLFLQIWVHSHNTYLTT
uniref:Uncharacterized protein n=1 Tax=Cacopsylla melanoneura TaxID=428564 RepID=A0A8D8LDI5_9HEMI